MVNHSVLNLESILGIILIGYIAEPFVLGGNTKIVNLMSLKVEVLTLGRSQNSLTVYRVKVLTAMVIKC